MIPRYARKEMLELWTDQARYQLWLEIELEVLKALGKEGKAPLNAYAEVAQRARFDCDEVARIEREVKHDVIAFLTNVAQNAGSGAAFMHRGLTSSDVLDTALALQLRRSGLMIREGMQQLSAAILRRAEEYRMTPCIGRSHGIHAEPTTFGLKMLGWFSEVSRQQLRLDNAIQEISVGKIAGAVGTYASVSPQLEAQVLGALGLRPETVPTQIVARDRHACFFSALAQIASSFERIAVEIRHLQRTEVREAEESFTRGQKGSSAMPHKRNPVLSENLCGLARLVRGYAQASLESVALWHERDISHSSVERVAGPDACVLIDFMVRRLTGIISNLVVYPERMLQNLESTNGLVYSGTLLLALVDKGLSREDAYARVQQHALAAWEGGAALSERVLADSSIRAVLSEQEIAEVFTLSRHLRHVDFIFERARSAGGQV